MTGTRIFMESRHHPKSSIPFARSLLGALPLVIWMCSRSVAFASPGEIDPTFNAGSGAQTASGSSASVRAAKLQADGKIVLAGSFTRFNGERDYIVRLNCDGSVDTTFSGPLDGPVSVLAILPDGKILADVSGPILGSSTSIARLDTNGNLDLNYRVLLKARFNSGTLVRDMMVLADGRVVIAGSFTNVNNTACSKIAILNPDGSLDPTFQPGNSIKDDAATALAQQSDGRWLVGGSNNSGSGPGAHLVRLSADGTLDKSFTATFTGTNVANPCAILVLRIVQDGSIFVGGHFKAVNDQARNGLAKLTPDGNVDSGFALPIESLSVFTSDVSISGMAVQSDGKLLVAGLIQIVEPIPYQGVLRLNVDGTLDHGFFSGAGDPRISSCQLLVQPDGAIIFSGTFEKYYAVKVNGIVRIQGGESQSPRVIGQPTSQTQPVGSRIELSPTVLGAPTLRYEWQRNGISIPGATNATLVLTNLQLNQGGGYTLKARNSFGEVTSVVATLSVVDLRGIPGSVDAIFDPRVNGPVSKMAVAPNGAILIVGAYTSVDGVSRRGMTRLHANGTLDATFASTNDLSGFVTFAGLGDGRVLMATSRYPTLGIPPNRIIGLSSIGSEEASLDFGSVLKSEGFDTNTYYTGTKFFSFPDGTPGVREHGNIGGFYKDLYFVLKFDGNVLTAKATNVVLDPTQPRETSGKIITTETEQIGVSPPFSYVLLRRGDGGSIDRSFRNVLGQVESLKVAVEMDDQTLVVSSPAPIGPFVPAGGTTLRRLNRDGTEDQSFPPVVFGRAIDNSARELVSDMVVLSGNKVLVAGAFPSCGGVSRGYLVRLDLGEPRRPAPPAVIDEPESLDVLTGQSAVFRVNPDAIGPLAMQWFYQDTPLLGETNSTLILTNVSGLDGAYSVDVRNSAGSVQSAPARLTVVPQPGGLVDPTFDPGTGIENGKVNALLLEPDGRILVGGTFTGFNGQLRPGLVRLNTDGSIDTGFYAGRLNKNSPSVAKLRVDALARFPDGRILFGGVLQQEGGSARTNVYRLFADGTLDASFQATPGHAPTIMSLVILPDNYVLVGGTFNYTNTRGIFFGDSFRNLVRLTPEGVLETSFKPHVTAEQSSFFTGSFNAGFVRSMALYGQKRLLVAGSFERPESGFARLDVESNGSRDPTFDPRLFAPTDEIGRAGVPAVNAMALDSSGDTAIASDFTIAGAAGNLARLTDSGHLSGFAQFGQGVTALAFQWDNKLIVGGSFTSLSGLQRKYLARLHKDGSADLSFGSPTGGPNGAVSAIAVEPAGSILIGGVFTSVDGVSRNGIARLYSSGKVFRELLRPRFENSTLTAEVHTMTGKKYTLERTESLASGNWLIVTTIVGDGNLKRISDSLTGSGQAFYRLRVE